VHTWYKLSSEIIQATRTAWPSSVHHAAYYRHTHRGRQAFVLWCAYVVYRQNLWYWWHMALVMLCTTICNYWCSSVLKNSCRQWNSPNSRQWSQTSDDQWSVVLMQLATPEKPLQLTACVECLLSCGCKHILSVSLFAASILQFCPMWMQMNCVMTVNQSLTLLVHFMHWPWGNRSYKWRCVNNSGTTDTQQCQNVTAGCGS